MSMQSALALLVPWVGANDPHHTLAADDFAVATELLDRSGNFHSVLLLRFPAVPSHWLRAALVLSSHPGNTILKLAFFSSDMRGVHEMTPSF